MQDTRSYSVGVKTAGDRDFNSNGLRFATQAEAYAYGDNLAMRWTAVREWAVLESTDEPNR